MKEKRLMAAVLLWTVHDLDVPRWRGDALSFAGSELFRFYAEALDLDPDVLKALIFSGRYRRIKIRAFSR